MRMGVMPGEASSASARAGVTDLRVFPVEHAPGSGQRTLELLASLSPGR